LDPKTVSEEDFGRPRVLLAVNATKRADHQPLRGSSAARVCGVKACDEQFAVRRLRFPASRVCTSRRCGGSFALNLRFRRLKVQEITMPIQRLHVGKRLSEAVIFTPGTERIVYLAGQVAENGKADMTTQTKQVLASIDRLLAEVGSDKSRLLSATIFLPDMADFAALNAVWEAWVVPGQTPARATVEAALANIDLKVEIQVVATAPA
jgi:enamine deaminase RidA (YjgF/YER057c/UK114 family)